jgi:4-hydroxybenzoate polyprenyltransferase
MQDHSLVGPGTTQNRGARWQIWAKALRLDHWAKNVLVVAGPVLSTEIISAGVLWRSVVLFILMGCIASGTYLINDLADLSPDRQHPTKRHRPLAARAISEQAGMAAAGALIVLSLLASLVLPIGCTASLVAYLIGTLAYSFWLKRQPIVDVMALAGLFTLRIVAGGFLVQTLISPWLLTFSLLFFLGLAIVKRYAELERVVRFGEAGVACRGYSAKDLPLLLSAGIGSGVSATVIFAIYLINEHYPRNIYARPQVLWVIIPMLLMWVLRAWHLTVHGEMNEDPVAFALRDRFSLALGVLVAITLLVAWT